MSGKEFALKMAAIFVSAYGIVYLIPILYDFILN